ncbi:MAG: outer membrane beta-barrel domain-containing protein [Chromatiales bacterium]|jgi:outer membrane beta-barrel protein
MVRRLGILLLTGAIATLMLATTSSPARAQVAAPAEEPQEQVVRPELDRREVDLPAIDTENFEIGAFAGVMSVEDFGTNLVWGARAAYHVTEDFFFEAAYGQTDTDETSFERLTQIQLIDDRTLRYYNVSFGVNVLPGESFLGRWAFTNAFFLIGGIGATDFNDDDEFTWNIGFGYRLLATDWLSLRVDARDHVFKQDLLGEEKTTHNLEATLGLGIYF